MPRRESNTLRAFRIMRDGRWHSKIELEKHCGQNGTRRARELREKKWGAWNVEIVRGDEIESQPIPSDQRHLYWYRINPEELKEREGEAALLATGQNVFAVDVAREEAEANPLDKLLDIELTAADAVFLLAVINNDAQLDHPRVKNLWYHARDRCAAKLAQALKALPDEVFRPNDVFDPKDY